MKILVVGAGLSGCTLARLMAESGHCVTVIEERDKIGGNCSDRVDENGILYHEYGPHLFHTNNKKVFDWLSRFTEWVPYRHKAMAMLRNGELVPFPVNAKTLRTVQEDKIIDTFFRPYTERMWGMPLEKVSPDILSRVPVRGDENEEYFPGDDFQAMPKFGYQKMFEEILSHVNIDIRLGEKFRRNVDVESKFDLIFNSMPIDEYFEFEYGKLEYRSLKFHHYNVCVARLFPVATVNFTDDGPYTRITEWKNIPNVNLYASNQFQTKITVEEPCSAEENSWQRFYPVPDLEGKNLKMYKRYQKDCPENMKFIGRCGQYKYINMDQAVELAMGVCHECLG